MRAHEEALLQSDAPLARLLAVPLERAQPALAQWAALQRLMLVQLAFVTRAG